MVASSGGVGVFRATMVRIWVLRPVGSGAVIVVQVRSVVGIDWMTAPHASMRAAERCPSSFAIRMAFVSASGVLSCSSVKNTPVSVARRSWMVRASSFGSTTRASPRGWKNWRFTSWR